MVEYKIDENLIWRDGEPIAVITSAGLLHIENVADEKYRLPIHNALEAAGRLAPYGKYVYLPVTDDPGKDVSGKPPVAGADKPELKTLRELCGVMSKMLGEAPPPMSKIFGDETEEVWAWVSKNRMIYDEISRNYVISIKNNRLGA